jgi:hypothetical protein
MLRLGILALALLAAPLTAGANTVACGGNSSSHAEVIGKHRAHRRPAPLEVMSDSLCADLIEVRRREIDAIEIMVEPGASRDAEEGTTDGTPSRRLPSRR